MNLREVNSQETMCLGAYHDFIFQNSIRLKIKDCIFMPDSIPQILFQLYNSSFFTQSDKSTVFITYVIMYRKLSSDGRCGF